MKFIEKYFDVFVCFIGVIKYYANSCTQALGRMRLVSS